MQVISYGDPSILQGNLNVVLMAGRRKCDDCYDFCNDCDYCRYDDCGFFCPCDEDEDECEPHCEYD